MDTNNIQKINRYKITLFRRRRNRLQVCSPHVCKGIRRVLERVAKEAPLQVN